MTGQVRLRDGVEIELSDGTVVVLDADDPDGDIHVLSHAHADHLFESDIPQELVCSALTADLARIRRPETKINRVSHPRVDLVESGHVPGSRSALVRDPDGTLFLYTGDVSTRDRLYLDGFDPIEADVLIIEATYGEPVFQFPPQDRIETEIVEWLTDTDSPVLLFGYTLGRAQMLQLLAHEAGRDRVLVTDAITRINQVIADHLSLEFDAIPYDQTDVLNEGDALVLPTQFARHGWVESLCDDAGALKAGFSGWAIEDGFAYQGGYDITFPLSDHCDFGELSDLVTAVDPDRIYTHHGSVDALATHLTSQGYSAQALKRNQTALGDF